jgi:glycopeptide antibiotics resistance protein
MIKSAILSVLNDIWPMITIFVVVLASIRIAYFIFNRNESFIFYKELTTLLFIIYVLFLFYIVTFQDNNFGVSNFIPFKEIFRYDINSRLFFKNVIGNVILFIPLGWYITYYTRTKKIYPALLLSIIISLAIELIQSYIGRVFDIDDIILNIIGGILGYLVYIFLYKIKVRLPKILQKTWFLNLVIILVFMLFMLYITSWYKVLLGA